MSRMDGDSEPSKHPLDPLDASEIEIAREAVLKARKAPILFRNAFTLEPPKAELTKYLQYEHSDAWQGETPHPARFARVDYDVVRDQGREYMESVIDIQSGQEVAHKAIENGSQQPLALVEFHDFFQVCTASPLFQQAVKELELDGDRYEVTMDPWPYGGPDTGEAASRYIQGLCFAKLKGRNSDTNHYAFPLPFIPVMDTIKKEIIRIDRLATGGSEDGLKYDTGAKNKVIEHCRPAEYVPELLDQPLRNDIKPLHVVQPDGVSFSLQGGSLIEWQKWRFRVGFTPREGAVLHDVRYNKRSILYRLSVSEMTVPYGDPRAPFHRKQAFDFGDVGAGRASNSLTLGCDCLGAIKYLDALFVDHEGKPSTSEKVVCIHEADNGLLSKHTNFRTNRAVSTRLRELIIQFIVTLANYEYIFAYRLNQAGGIVVETRATGIVSGINIDPGKTSPYGNIVSPGVLAQNHQHIFALRIDPAIDGNANTLFTEESLPIPMNPKTNPFGNGYQICRKAIKTSSWIDASPFTNLVLKIANTNKLNPISQKPVAYKLIPAPTQLILADPESRVAKRAAFAQHHVWVTKYRDHELFAGGEYTNQSEQEIGGVADAVARREPIENEDIVVWNVFGLTHNPRVEDWPVMPVEVHQVSLTPSDFFDKNPALDVPGERNRASVEIGANEPGASCCNEENKSRQAEPSVQTDPVSHLQGDGSVEVPKDRYHGDVKASSGRL